MKASEVSNALQLVQQLTAAKAKLDRFTEIPALTEPFSVQVFWEDPNAPLGNRRKCFTLDIDRGLEEGELRATIAGALSDRCIAIRDKLTKLGVDPDA